MLSLVPAPAPGLALGATAMDLAHDLKRFTDEPGQITRLYLSSAHRAAAAFLRERLEKTGLKPVVDAAGSVTARYEGQSANAPALIVGSHIDSVIDAGAYDGVLGVTSGIAAVEYLAKHGIRLPFAIEIVAFGDEENVRFPTAYSTSAALVGNYRDEWLGMADTKGTKLADALVAFGGDPDRIPALARNPKDVLGYIELHIEQGPVLEREGLPLGIVSAIAGISGLLVTINGVAGHAGTVPMNARRDASTAAADMVLSAERIARDRPGIVATVGQFHVEPGANNVIPGQATFSLDLRSPIDTHRKSALTEIETTWREIARSRHVELTIEPVMDAPATAMDESLSGALEKAVADLGVTPLRLPSGAGHDAATMAKLCPAAMLFVRCKGGISHNPAESVTIEDADLAVRALLSAIGALAEKLTR